MTRAAARQAACARGKCSEAFLSFIVVKRISDNKNGSFIIVKTQFGLTVLLDEPNQRYDIEFAASSWPNSK
jgi:hypothetical protein